MRAFAVLSLVLGVAVLGTAGGTEGARGCVPTRADALGPFYEAGAPVRSKVGTGYLLSGRVLAARTCRPIAKARIELWLANPQGEYDDAHRATMFASQVGCYRFESNRPVAYSERPPHIHLRISARGFRTLVTQHYPRAGRSSATFNVVLRRS
jgi:protocatechuate 3,4-dioxygenase beta subunit